MTQLFLSLFLTPGRSHRSIVALVSSQHNLGQICVQVLLFSVLQDCLFSSFLFELRFLSCSPPVTLLRNQIVGGASQSAPTLCSTYSLRLDHSSGDLWTTSKYASVTCRLPHTARHTTDATKTQARRQTQIHTHNKHAQTHCSSELLKIPKACCLQNNPGGYKM